MAAMQLFDTPLEGLNLIEASAGTGKTYTICGLYLRLVAELGLGVEQILVVTYTKAATAELRERIRGLLVSALAALEEGDEAEGICAQLAVRCDDPAAAVRRLRRALLDFDRANISTIHGFCQRMLADHAFESGSPFQTEMLTDQRLLLQEVVDDFWRLRIQDLPSGLVSHLLDSGFSSDWLVTLLSGRVGRPYLERRGGEAPADTVALETEYLQSFALTRRSWLEQRASVEKVLLEDTGLHRGQYRKEWITNWLASMQAYLEEETPGTWFKQFPKFTSANLGKSVKKGHLPPGHPFFDHCDRLLVAREALVKAYELARVRLLTELFDYAEGELERRKRTRGVQFYDDLLVNLQRALESDTGEKLAGRIRSSCEAALIDEFQDTDPLQYGIFRAIFDQSQRPVFLVGDPKQAIYSFRGADIFAYLRAGRDVANRYTLDRNWRATPALVDAINTIFRQCDRPFFYDEIEYFESSAGRHQEASLSVTGESEKQAFRLSLLPDGLTRKEALDVSVQACATEIARLLGAGRQGEATLDGRPLTGKDIAVLVRTHSQGEWIKQALLAMGVSSVQHSLIDVFKSKSAESLELVLKAVADPAREGLVLGALATDILGAEGADLLRIAHEDEALEPIQEDFREYHRLWLEQGFMRMIGRLLHDKGVSKRLLEMQFGARRLTDLLHLVELLHQQERAGGPGIERLINWFSDRRSSEIAEEETAQLRLESDAQLVQILTIHKSKGLQYPVVFFPFGWDGGPQSINAGEPYEFHDPAMDHRAVLELGSQRWQEDRVYALQESMAEGLRLTYVALTRAQQRCYLYWGNVNRAWQSALAWLLYGDGVASEADPLAALESRWKALEADDHVERLRQLAADSGGTILAGYPPQRQLTPTLSFIDDNRTLSARTIDLPSWRVRRISSFTALASGRGGVEVPDHDGVAVAAPLSLSAAASRDIFAFPRGAGPGSCLHGIFEQLDFQAGDRSEIEQLVSQQLRTFGIDSSWTPVVSDMVERVLASPLDRDRPDFRLGRIPRSRCLVELAFCYPVLDLDSGDLSRLLLDNGFADREELKLDLQRLSFTRVAGFMKGFIDLVFEFEGRFYLVDYKSNWLGADLEDYGQGRMADAMAAEHYYLQYLLYTLALHRYLRRRIVGYRYDRHFGAVYYLFLRGMTATPGDVGGIYRARPPRHLIEALDGYIGLPQGNSS